MRTQEHSSNGTTQVAHHILSVLVENRFGVLTRVAGLFARRGFNIVSLAVSPTENPEFSRMTIVVDAESAPLEQVTKQLNKLIPVLEITEISSGQGIEREVMLVTVRAGEQRSQLDAALTQCGGSVVDAASDAVTVMVVGEPSELDAAEQQLQQFPIIELQRSGRISLPKLGA